MQFIRPTTVSLRTLVDLHDKERHGTAPACETQEIANQHFDRVSHEWKEIYEQKDLSARVYQQRRSMTLEWVDGLGLPAGARVLEVGCGAGLMSVALGGRGYRVDAMDCSTGMVELTRRHIEEAGMSDRVSTSVGDSHSLNYADDSFNVVMALGVTPFLHSLPVAMAEMLRVLKPGGYLILSADHRWRLISMLDPALSPLLAPVRQVIKKSLRGVGLWSGRKRSPDVYMYSRREFDSIVSAAGLQLVCSSMWGFGPFTFMGMQLPDVLGSSLDRGLQALADRGVPVLRATGAQYLILGRKSA